MIAGITEWILSLNGALALAIVFLVPALEASAFLGFLFPGEIAILLGGVLAFHGRLPLWAVIVAAVAGAIVGDSIGYFVGRRWGHQLLRGVGAHVPFVGHRIDEHLESARAYLKRRGGAAVFFGRFVGALRVMIPGLAGMAEIPYTQFALYNIAGGLIWGTGFVLLGYFAGAAWHRVASDASRVGLGLLVVVLLGLVTARVLRSIREGTEPLSDRLARRRPIAWVRHRFPRASAWSARRIDTASPSGFTLSFTVLAGAICAWVFTGITQDVVAKEESALTDPRVMSFIVAHRIGWATATMKIATWLGSNATLIPLVLGVGFWGWFKARTLRPAGFMIAALAGANLWYRITKSAVGRSRPPVSVHLINISGFAFPSGHATAVVATWGMAALLFGAGRCTRTRVGLWAGAGVISLLVGFSRIYLGVHWWTDVVGGFALGGLWLCVLAVVYLKTQFEPVAAAEPMGSSDPRSVQAAWFP